MTVPLVGARTVLADRYEIERELGRGGAAAVHLARDRKLKRQVAIKVLLPDIASVVNVERFLREVQIAARLVHPHIVPLIESGQTEGLPYYVMPFIDGETLRTRLLRDGRLPVDDAVRIAREVADALDYAHAVGVVHRDIKPENILIAGRHAVVADFGIAKAISAASDARTPADRAITETDLVVGTPAYMSLEQMAGDANLDGRSDIYSLGVVLYETLAGGPPFKGATPLEIFSQRVTDAPVPLRDLRPDTPPAVEAAVARALAREPGDRFATAHDFANALAEGDTPRPGPVPAEPEASIAVLPFASLAADPDGEIFSDGMTEEVINALMRLRRLRVVARTSVFAFKNKYEDVREIGRRLNVRSVLEGSIRRSGGRLRVTAKLINVADGFQTWYGEFDRDIGDAIALQDDLAQSIVQTLQPSLLGTETPSRRSTSPDAYDLYLRGRHFWNQRTPVAMAKAQECYRQAITLDPDFALAHAGEADLYTVFFIYGFAAPSEAFPRARDAALRAIALDPAAAEPRTALGAVKALIEWDWRDAASEFRRAISLNPQYSTAYQWYANYVLIPLGRLDEAIAELQRARKFDPFSPVINMSVGMALLYARRYDQAEAELRRTIDLDPNYMVTHYFLGRTLVERGVFGEGIDVLRRALTLSGGNPMATAQIGYAHAREGDRAGAESSLNMLRAQSSQRYVSSCLAAQVHAALGNVDEAIHELERGVEERAPDTIWLGVDPGFDSIRSDPRFIAILERIGLAT